MSYQVDQAAAWLAFLLARREQALRVEDSAFFVEVLDLAIADARDELARQCMLDDWLMHDTSDKFGDVELPF